MNKKEIVFDIPGSKSIINRILIMATYLNEPVTMTNFSTCRDVLVMLENLKNLGFISKIDNNICTLTPPKSFNRKVKLYIHDAGTVYRFLVARLAAWEGLECEIKVSKQLSKRPIKPLADLLLDNGAIMEIDGVIKISGKKLDRISGLVDPTISSQFYSAIMLLAPILRNGVELQFKEKPVSFSYLSLTQQVLRIFGIKSNLTVNNLKIAGLQKMKSPESILIEPDYSSACYFWALGAMSNIPIGTSVKEMESMQGDFNFWKVLQKMGADIIERDNKILVQKRNLNGINIDMKDMPDQVPTLAIIALFAKGKTTVSGIAHLKHKESDRISALVDELTKIGAMIEYKNSTLTINPISGHIPKNVLLRCYDDHRLVMVFSLLKLIYPTLRLDDSSAVEKSFPEFFLYWKELCENLDIKNSLKDITKYE